MNHYSIGKLRRVPPEHGKKGIGEMVIMLIII